MLTGVDYAAVRPQHAKKAADVGKIIGVGIFAVTAIEMVKAWLQMIPSNVSFA